MSLLMGLGASQEAGVHAAGVAAARQMLTHLGGKPQLTLVFAAIRFADPRLLEGIRSVTQDAPLIGCTTAGGISTWGHLRQSVIVVGLRGSGAGFVTGVAHGISRDPEVAGRQLAADLKAGEPGAMKAALVFPDGLARNNSAVIRGLQKGLGKNVPIVGGAAGDDFYFQRSFQFFDDQILTDSIPAAVFFGEVSIGIGVQHGWAPLGRPRQVTKSRGEIIYELDGRPAISIYEKYLGTKRQRLLKRPLALTTLSYPLGMMTADSSDYVLRSAFKMGEKGSLICNGEMAEGSSVRLMIGGYESALSAAAEAARQASEAVGSNRFKGALVFSNGGRQKMLGSESQGEIDVIRDSLGGVGVRLAGFYGYGEPAPMAGNNVFHNESVVVMALG